VSENTVGSSIICWYSNSKYSHVDIGLPDGTFLGSRYYGGVQIRPNNYLVPKEELWLGQELGIKEVDLLAWAKSHIGDPYNWKGIYSFAFDTNWRVKNSWLCSTFVLAAFEAVGMPLLNMNYETKATPADITMSLNLVATEVWS